MRRRIAPVVSIVAILLVAGVAWLVGFGHRDRELKDPPRPASAAAAAASPPISVAPESVASPRRVEESVPDASAGKPKTAEQLEQLGYVDPSEGDEIEGTLVVADEAGVEHADRSGSFQPDFWSANSCLSGDRVRVDAGRFRLRVPAGKELGVDDVELDGRAADANPGRYAIVPAQPLVVRAQWSRDVLLHVVDATTHEELRGVTVLWNGDWEASDTRHPGKLGADHTVIENAVSPIQTHVPNRDGRTHWQTTLYATTSGHAWGSVVADYRMGGPATIELSRGGDLEVTIDGEIPPLPPLRSGSRENWDTRVVIRLREAPPSGLSDAEIDARIVEHPESARRFAESTPDRNGTARFTGVSVGPLLVLLERGDHWRDATVLAHSAVSIVEGETTRVTLRTGERADLRRRVPFSGTVHYSHEWGRSDVDLHFEPLKIPGGTSVENFELRMHDLWPVDGLPDVHRFDAGQVLPGRYLLKSYACRFQQLIETGPDGTDHAEIVIGDPADVVVRIVDADNGSPLQSPISLYWICKRPAESTGGVFEGCEWDESIHAARLRAPAGEIELGVSSELGLDYEVVGSNVIQARPGSNEATLRLRAANTIVLKPTVDGTEAKWPVDDDGRVSMTKLVAADDSEAEVTIHNLSEEALDFFVPKPGRYIVRVVAPKGFDAVASFEVEARKGARVVAVVALHRSR